MAKWTKTMEMKQNQTFFHGTYSNLTSYVFLSKNVKVFQWLLESKFLSFITKVNSNNENETKSDIFSWDIFKSDIIFHWSQKYFNDFLIASFNFIAKLKTNNYRPIKLNSTCVNLIVFFLIYRVEHYLEDFWNLFLDKFYFKNEW